MWELGLKQAREWGAATERPEGINLTKGATEKFEQKEDACGMVKHFAFSMPLSKCLKKELEKKRGGEKRWCFPAQILVFRHTFVHFFK